MRRGFWFTVGVVSLALGAIGVVLPVLPTTPFVILAAFAFGKSTPALQLWLENHQTFGPMIIDWREHGSISPRYKIIAISMMVAAIVLSIAMGVSTIVLAIQAICIIAAGSFILTRPS